MFFMKYIVQLLLFIFIYFIAINKPLLAEDNLLTLKQQLDRLQREVTDLSKSVFTNSKLNNDPATNVNNDQTINFAAIDMRIHDIEKDIKNLNSNLEDLIFRLDDINNNLIILEEEFDTKIQILSNQNKNIDSIQNQNDLDNEDSDNTLGTLKLSSDNNQTDNIENDQMDSENLQNVDLEEVSPENQFQIAFDQIRNKKYKEAILSFQNFISNNPENQLSGSAHYWLGELFLLEKNSREAALILAEGYQKYPKSIKAPDMLYKLSEALLEINKNEEACNTLTKLSKDFPEHKLKNKAEKKKLEISCNISVE